MEKNARIATGELKGLLALFSPILLVAFSNGLFLLIEKLFFTRVSTQAIQVAVSAAYVNQIFQSPCMALTMMAQVFVGRWLGSKDLNLIGPGVWQFIWFSLLSILITVPAGLIYGRYYYQGMEIEKLALPYFDFLIGISWLHVLGAGLSSFYLGLGKTRLVLWGTLGSQIIKLIFAYVLIFGWGAWVPAMGLTGGVLSSLIAQGGYCLLLFGIFLNDKHARLYHSRSWTLYPKFFWECIHPGLLRAISRIFAFTSWASIAHLMVSKGGDYLLVLSVGGTLFLTFLGDAVCQAQTTVVSQILGTKNIPLLKKAFHSGFILVSALLVILCIPYLIFPTQIFHYVFPQAALSDYSIRKVFFGILLSSSFFLYGFVLISYILAFKDTKFSAFLGAFNWVNGFLLMYVAIKKFDIAADQFWLVLCLMHGSTTLFYYLRTRWLISKYKAETHAASLEVAGSLNAT